MIRGKYKSCPFGLPITGGCNCIGESIFELKPITKKSTKEDKEANYEVFLMLEDDSKGKCYFADLVLDDKNAVDCRYNLEDFHKASGNSFVSGSPIYPNLYIGTSKSSGTYPIGTYGDDNIRSVYYGLVGLID